MDEIKNNVDESAISRAVLTGATGAVGMALIQHLLQNNVEILVISHRGSARATQIPDHPLITKVEVNLSELSQISELWKLEGYDYLLDRKWDVFYHFAWDGTTGSQRNDAELQMRNASYTLDAVKLAKKLGCHTFIGSGSQAEYGRVEGTLNAQTPAFPENGYGMAKLAAGQMSRLLCRNLEMRHIWVRILSVYGPYDGKNSMVMSTLNRLRSGERPQFTAGEQMWDYLYSKDAARALFLMAQKGIDGKTYCLGSGNAKPLREYICQIRDAVNPNAELGIGELPYADGQVMYLCADLSELSADTGFVPEYPFEEGIRETAESIEKDAR